MGPAPSCRCQERQLSITDWQRGNVQFRAALVFAAVFLAAVFTAKAQGTPGSPPARCWEGSEQQHWREGGV